MKMSELPRTPEGRAAIAAEIDAAARTAFHDRAQAIPALSERSGPSLKFFRAVAETLLLVDEVIAAIRARHLETWTLPILSWVSLRHLDLRWKDKKEREELTAAALADDGALWWARPFEVAPFHQQPPLAWRDLVAGLRGAFPMTMPLGPFIPPAKFHGRSIETWALSSNADAFGARGVVGTWPYTVVVRLHARPRNRGGSTRGAPPCRSVDILLADPRQDRDFKERREPRSYFRDSDRALKSLGLHATPPDYWIDAPVESIVAGSDPATFSILLGCYLDRNSVLSAREVKSVREQVELALVTSAPEWLRDVGDEFGPSEARKLCKCAFRPS